MLREGVGGERKRDMAPKPGAHLKATSILIAVLILASLFAVAPAVAPPFSGAAQVDVGVNKVISVTLNTTTIGFGNLNPGDANVNAATGFPVNITISSSTNVDTYIAANASTDGGNHTGGNFTNAAHAANPSIPIGNLVFSNAANFTLNLAHSLTEQGNATFGDWNNIQCPCGGSPQLRNYFNRISIPATAKGEAYHAHVVIKVAEMGT